MLCNTTSAPLRQNFNLSFFEIYAMFLKNQAAFLKQHFRPMDASIAFKLG